MKEFSNIISVYPLIELTNENPTPWNSDIIGTHNFYADNFIFDPLQSESEPGVSFNCDKTLYIDNPSDSDASFFSYPVKSIVVIKDTAGNKYPIGTKTLPATVMIQKNLNKSQLTIKSNTLTNPF
jgi:hypothetical protein